MYTLFCNINFHNQDDLQNCVTRGVLEKHQANGFMHIGIGEGRKNPATVTRDLHFSSAHLHRDISHNDVVKHIHSTGRH